MILLTGMMVRPLLMDGGNHQESPMLRGLAIILCISLTACSFSMTTVGDRYRPADPPPCDGNSSAPAADVAGSALFGVLGAVIISTAGDRKAAASECMDVSCGFGRAADD